MQPMTQKQRDFAEEHHNIVYTFLKTRRLKIEDYYDIVIFGFLTAAQRYTEDEHLQQSYSFTTIAFRKMDDSLAEHRRSENRLKRKADVLSLDAPLKDTENMCFADTIPSEGATPGEQAETKVIYIDALLRATAKQRQALVATAAGYTAKEAAEKLGTTQTAIHNRLFRVRAQARAAYAT